MFVVTGRNAALGAFSAMSSAVASAEAAFPLLAWYVRGPHYREGTNGTDTISIVELMQDKPHSIPTRLLRDQREPV